ncbi:cytochrome P450 [Actinomadura alba]|uniref:Cytochrome P450 n=1 Tax=Actinomadura alba TaxID=406431 RepID=A0ABR7LLP2_9ACTN|nr:cytochrome P450 [Actinomadura alba]MBC6465660.1 cytochrome P450 [Actinomadura alba]
MTGALAADPISALAETPGLLDPYPVYARLRESDPVYWSDRIESWVLTRYDDCVSVLRDPASFASDWRRIGERIPEPMLSIQSLDPPAHTHIRHLMVDAVRALDQRALERTIADQVRARADRLRGRSGSDYVAEFAEPLALETITAVLGVPPLEPAWFLPISQAIVDGMDAGVWPETGAPAVAARAELAELAAGWLADPPKEGLVGYVAAHAADSGIPRPVLLNTLRAVLHAGFESAGRLLGNGLLALLAERDALTWLAQSDLSRAVDELVRFDAPVQADGRACVVETRIGEQVIAAGDPVTMLLGAANRDPSRFPDPDMLDFARHPNQHLGFGRGAHSCLGQSLAILQARVVFGILAAEYPGIRTVSEPVHRRNLTLRGLAELHISIN